VRFLELASRSLFQPGYAHCTGSLHVDVCGGYQQGEEDGGVQLGDYSSAIQDHPN
jgi:hypothetical protein